MVRDHDSRDSPGDRLAPFWGIHLHQGKIPNAGESVEGNAYRWPAESALFQTALCLEELQLRPLAQKAHQSYLARYPEGRWAQESRAGLERTGS